MILRFYRTGGRDSPPDAESVELATDGRLSGWRSVSTVAVGWFAGRLPDPDVASIQALVTAIAGSTAPTGPAPPDAPSETLELADGSSASVANVEAAGAGQWPPLISTARALLERLTDFPRAAIGITLPAADSARLAHRGVDPLVLDLATVGVRATAWQGYYEPAGDWRGSVMGTEHEAAGPGWSYDLSLGSPAPPGADVTVHVSASFSIIANGKAVPVRVSHAPPITAPAP